MSTQTQSRNKPATVQSSPSSRMGDAMAWIAKAANQPMVLETVDLGPLGAEDVEVSVEHCPPSNRPAPAPPRHRSSHQDHKDS